MFNLASLMLTALKKFPSVEDNQSEYFDFLV